MILFLRYIQQLTQGANFIHACTIFPSLTFLMSILSLCPLNRQSSFHSSFYHHDIYFLSHLLLFQLILSHHSGLQSGYLLTNSFSLALLSVFSFASTKILFHFHSLKPYLVCFTCPSNYLSTSLFLQFLYFLRSISTYPSIRLFFINTSFFHLLFFGLSFTFICFVFLFNLLFQGAKLPIFSFLIGKNTHFCPSDFSFLQFRLFLFQSSCFSCF